MQLLGQGGHTSKSLKNMGVRRFVCLFLSVVRECARAHAYTFVCLCWLCSLAISFWLLVCRFACHCARLVASSVVFLCVRSAARVLGWCLRELVAGVIVHCARWFGVLMCLFTCLPSDVLARLVCVCVFACLCSLRLFTCSCVCLRA